MQEQIEKVAKKINPYSSKSTCRACGASNASTHFVSATKGDEDISFIRRHCARCGCSWKELPLYRIQEGNQSERFLVHIIGLSELDGKIKEIVRESLSRVFDRAAFDKESGRKLF